MPKIRDLGINSIPATMRPLEVGRGGYRLGEGGGTIQCPDGTCDNDGNDDAPGGGTIQCPDGTCEKDKDKDGKSPRDDDRNDRGLNTLAISQLRQQLDQHIASI